MSREQDRYDQLLRDIRREFPNFRIVPKRESRVQRTIHVALIAVTLGGMRDYLNGYHTTWGQAVFVADGWEAKPADDRYVTMRHELIHMRQFRRFTFPGLAFLYLLVPLPLGLAYFRALFERQAYAETIRAAAEVYGPQHVRRGEFRERILRQFTGPAYGWMWPFRGSLNRWYDRVLEEMS